MKNWPRSDFVDDAAAAAACWCVCGALVAVTPRDRERHPDLVEQVRIPAPEARNATVRRVLVVMRAHNEEATAGQLVAELRAGGYDVALIASACTDRTEGVARAAGAEVIPCPLGIGNAFRAAFQLVAGAPFVQIDADLTRLRVDALARLEAAALAGRMGRGSFDSAGRASSQLPGLAAAAGVELPPVPPQALTTAYTAWPTGFAANVPLESMPDNRGADLYLAVTGWRAGYTLECVPCGARDHTRRDGRHINTLTAGNRRALEVLAGLR